MSQKDLTALENEVSLMQLIDHPNICKYMETYEDHHTMYICMELCQGGELSVAKI